MTTRHLVLVSCFLIIWGRGYGSPPQETKAEPKTASSTATPKPFTTQIKKAVGLMKVRYMTEAGPAESDGTCFCVLFPDKRGGDDFGFVYLVTNKHVSQPGIEENKTYTILNTTIRLNLLPPAQGSQEAFVPVGPRFHWYYSTDDSVNLAVMPILPDQSRFDFLTFPIGLFATSDVVQSQSIVEGDRILFSGYFYQFPGEKKFQPIVREGTLAMLPDENLDTTLKKPGKLYLGDLHVFGGNSGSPVFVDTGGFRSGVALMGQDYRFLGIVSGFYHEDSNLKLTIAATYKGTLEQNSGIAMIVPADELLAILNSPPLQAIRDDDIARRNPRK